MYGYSAQPKGFCGFCIVNGKKKKTCLKMLKVFSDCGNEKNDGKFLFNNLSINSLFPAKLCKLKERTNVKKKITNIRHL